VSTGIGLSGDDGHRTNVMRIDLLFVVKTVLGAGIGARAIGPWARVVCAS
jgi:hypothetical protein